MTQFVIVPGINSGATNTVFTLLNAETGEGLANHFCSNAYYAKSDLYSGRPERMEKWKKEFGEIKVDFIDEIDLTEEELLERNKKFYNK